MNIVKGCVINCELLYEPAIQYVPVKILVKNDEYLKGAKGKVYHSFEIEVMEHLSPSRFNKHFPIGEPMHARAGDLYNGNIIEYPSNYDELQAEKQVRKLLIK